MKVQKNPLETGFFCVVFFLIFRFTFVNEIGSMLNIVGNNILSLIVGYPILNPSQGEGL
jgi:hypothetical protein